MFKRKTYVRIDFSQPARSDVRVYWLAPHTLLARSLESLCDIVFDALIVLAANAIPTALTPQFDGCRRPDNLGHLYGDGFFRGQHLSIAVKGCGGADN